MRLLLHLPLIAFCSLVTTLHAVEDWEWVSGGTFTDVIHDGSRFLAVGHEGVMKTSDDGVAWTQIKPGHNWFAEEILFAGGQYVVVGGFGQIFTSSDAQNWTPRTSGTNQWLFGVVYSQDQYVAVGRHGAVLTSPDAMTWTSRTSGTTAELAGIAAGGGHYAAVGQSGTLIASPDAITWTAYDSGTPVYLSAIIHDGVRFIAQGSGNQARSADGTNWVSVPSDSEAYQDIAFGAGRYVTVGIFGRISVSSNNEDWTTIDPPPTDFRLRSVAHGNGVWAAVGDTGLIVTSDNSTDWALRSNVGTDAGILDLVFAEGVFVSVASGARITRSTDGLNWIRQPIPVTSPMHGVAHGNGRFVAVGDKGTILTSPDGAVWTAAEVSNVSAQLNGVSWNGSLWCAVGSGGESLTSPDAVNWTVRTSGVSEDFTGIASGNGIFVALAGLKLYTSPDGSNWIERAHPGNSTLRDILFADGRFLIAENDSVLTSADGAEWEQITENINGPRALAYGDGIYLVAGFSGWISWSSDGTNWTLIDEAARPTTQSFQNAAYGLGRFIATAQTFVYSSTPVASETIPVIEFIRLPSGQFLLRWEATAGAAYDVYSSSTLQGMVLRPDITTTVSGVVGEAIINDNPLTLPRNFYQVRER